MLKSLPMSKELFDQLKGAYGLIPVFEPGGALRRPNSELKPKVIEKIRDVIDLSPTTGYYQKALPLLASKVFDKGRRMPGSDDEIALRDALQLSAKNELGIFDEDLAAKGEAMLFLRVLEDFLSSVAFELTNGKDPDGSVGVNPDDAQNSNYFPDKTMTEMKNYMISWSREYQRHYGRPILSAPKI